MEEVVIVAAARTPIGSFLGALSPLSAPQLGGVAISEAVRRAEACAVPPSAPTSSAAGQPGAVPLAATVDEVIMGNVLSAGLGQAPARQAMLAAGLPPSVGALTVNKVCGSGLKAVMLGATAIRAGEARVIVAGGMESMSNAPYLLPRARTGLRMGHSQLLDAMIHDGLWDPYHDYHMGMTGELVARTYRISREEQDVYAHASYEKALHAQSECVFSTEIVPVTIPQPKGEPVIVSRDEDPRPTTPEKLAALRPAFQKDGTITAGSASNISDGAAAVVLMSAREAEARGAPVLGRILAGSTYCREPEWVMMAPVDAIRNAVTRAGLTLDQIDLFEINEPFAAAAIAVVRELGIPSARVNIHGGAIALGHPIGATGARLLVTLLHALRRTGTRYGVAGLCLGGGEAVAMVVETN